MAKLNFSNIISASLDPATVANLNLNANSLSDIGNTILGSETLTDAFIKGICTKVAMQNITAKQFKNPFAVFKQNDTTKGNFGNIEDIYINPSPDRLTNMDGTQLLKQENPKGATAYYSLNRKSTLKVTFSDLQLRNAFSSENAFMNFYNSIVNTIYSGDAIAEFNLARELLNKRWKMHRGGGDGVKGNLPHSGLWTNDEPLSTEDFAKAVSNIVRDFIYPSTKYCPYNVGVTNSEDKLTTWTDKEDICIVLPAGLQTALDFDILSKAFNKSFVDFTDKTILVNGFDVVPASETHEIGFSQRECLGFVMDRNALKIVDAKYKPMLFKNPENDSVTFYLHHWQYFFLSQFCNICMLVNYETREQASTTPSSDKTGSNTTGPNEM